MAENQVWNFLTNLILQSAIHGLDEQNHPYRDSGVCYLYMNDLYLDATGCHSSFQSLQDQDNDGGVCFHHHH